MPSHVAILEDETDRILEMKQCLDELLPEYKHCFFDNAQEMVDWLHEHAGETVLISLDHDLPIVQYRMGERVEPGSGRQVAEYLATQSPTCPVIIHSHSGNEGEGMARLLADANWPMTRIHPHGEYEWIRKTWAPLIEKYVEEGWIFASR